MNLVGYCAPTLTWGAHRSSIHNTIPSERPHQLYLAILVINKTNPIQSDARRGDNDIVQRKGHIPGQHPAAAHGTAQNIILSDK